MKELCSESECFHTGATEDSSLLGCVTIQLAFSAAAHMTKHERVYQYGNSIWMCSRITQVIQGHCRQHMKHITNSQTRTATNGNERL